MAQSELEHPEFDIFNPSARMVICEDNTKNIPMIGHGDINGVLTVGNEYEVESVEVYSSYTLVKLKGIDGEFNSVLFAEKPGYKYVTDTDSYKFWH
jgi:hypothetical protein